MEGTYDTPWLKEFNARLRTGLSSKVDILDSVFSEVDKLESRAHVLEGLILAHGRIEDIMVVGRKSESRIHFQKILTGVEKIPKIKRFSFSQEQTLAIERRRLWQLSQMDVQKLDAELDEIRGKIRQEQKRILAQYEACLRDLGFDNFIDLSAGKAIPSDVGFGRVRIPLDNHLGAKPGDVVLIEGATGPLSSRGSTAALVWRALPVDSGFAVARMDWLTRKNARLRLGEKSRLRKVDPEQCSELTLYLDLEGETMSGEVLRYLKNLQMVRGKGLEGLVRREMNGRPVMKDDALLISSLKKLPSGKILLFRVKETEPRGVVIVRPETRIDIVLPDPEPHEFQDEFDEFEERLEIVDKLLEDMSLSQRKLLLTITGMLSKSTLPDSNPKEKGTH